MRRAEDPAANQETLQTLDKISETCDVCQRLSDQLERFRVYLPNDDIVFNRTILMDLMTLDSKTMIHIACKDTLFNAAAFVKGDHPRNLELLRSNMGKYLCWAFVQHLHELRASISFGRMDKSAEVMCHQQEHFGGGVCESRNALGVRERYHAYLRHIYRNVKAEHARMDLRDALSLSTRR